jgi:glutathione synthase/RimK-type ligase-like ATP-grasp enzyme
MWFLPSRFVSPRLWDYSRQVYEFAAGLELQGNRLLCSAAEVLYWENKAFMQSKLAEVGADTPKTIIVASEDSRSAECPFEPVLVKEEHSAGSAGVHYFERAVDALDFLRTYPFRPTESVLVQEVVPGATRDLRLTVVGKRMIPSASFWRSKSAEAERARGWTTTATKYGSSVRHEEIPEQAVECTAELLRKLGLRMGGIDLMWVDDDVSGTPLVLEVSPYFQPNPPKPRRYDDRTYAQYKRKPFIKDGYFARQYSVFRDIAGQILEQRLF